MKERLKDIILKHGIENVTFEVSMRPLQYIPLVGMAFTSSSDEPQQVTAIIDESRYKVSDGYKITLKAIQEGFGRIHYYQSDLESIIKDGHAKMIVS